MMRTVKASHLIILDGQNLSAGPLATAYLDHRIPFGFHGNWRNARINRVRQSNATLLTSAQTPVGRVLERQRLAGLSS